MIGEVFIANIVIALVVFLDAVKRLRKKKRYSKLLMHSQYAMLKVIETVIDE